MADKIEQPIDVTETPNDEIKTSEDAVKKSVATKVIFIAIIVLAMLNVAGGYWLWQQQLNQAEVLSQQFEAQAPKQDSTDKIKASLTDLESTLKTQIESVNSQQAQLQNKVAQLQETQTLTQGDVQLYWSLSEVQYLLTVANQRVFFSSDVKGAEQALNMADDLISDLSDPQLKPLRALIADEQLALSSSVQPDIEGMAFKLQSAIDKVDSLQVMMAPPIEEPTSDSEAFDLNGVKSALSKAWQEVKSLVVIRKQQDGKAAVLIPEQRYFLYQNLRLKLETARFALLSGKSSVYTASLTSAEEWLETYFIGNERDAILSSIKQMKQQSVTASVPDISQSLLWLKGFLK
jgi:uroporphyrin-3 C-methyltransferase